MPPKKSRTVRRAPAKKARALGPRALHYKVVELSNVDEAALERTVNEWVGQGWTFDGVQFAMRESSKRPSMAFVFFTREGAPLAAELPDREDERGRAIDVAEAHLARMVAVRPVASAPALDAWERLKALADDDPGAT